MTTMAEQVGKFEPASQHRFRIYFDEVGGTPLLGREQCEIAVKSVNLPEKSVDEIEMPVGTEVIYYAGRRKHEPLNLVLRDFLDATVFAFMENWSKKVHDDATGRRGYKSEYSGTARLQLIGVNEEVIREWKLVNIWPQSFKSGSADMTSNDQIELEATLRYDKAIPTTY